MHFESRKMIAFVLVYTERILRPTNRELIAMADFKIFRCGCFCRWFGLVWLGMADTYTKFILSDYSKIVQNSFNFSVRSVSLCEFEFYSQNQESHNHSQSHIHVINYFLYGILYLSISAI